MDELEPVQKPKAPAAAEQEEAPKELEITQTDHINKAMLNSFKALLDSNQFRFPQSTQKEEPHADDNDDFADDGSYEDDDLYSTDPEKYEEERKKAAAFFKEMLLQVSSESSTASAPTSVESTTKP